MTHVRRAAILGAALAALAVVLIVGVSDESPGPAVQATTTAETATTAAEALSPLPSPPAITNIVFERAFSECATYDAVRLAGKYKVADRSEETVAIAVGIGWARYFNGGQDAAEEGRLACLQGFSRS